MQYDRDLRRGRHIAALVAIINAAAALHLASTRDWIHAAVAALWTAGCLFIMALFKANQRTRDEVRQAAAMIAAGVIAPGAITRYVVARGAVDSPRIPPGALN